MTDHTRLHDLLPRAGPEPVARQPQPGLDHRRRARSSGSSAACAASRRTRRSSRRRSRVGRLRRPVRRARSAPATRSRTPTGTLVTNDIGDALRHPAPGLRRERRRRRLRVGRGRAALARDTDGTIASARHLHETIDEPNLYVKIPGTAEGLPAIQQMIAEGRSINVTLLFGLERYGEVIEAYLAGLEACRGRPVRRVVGGVVLRQPGRHRGRPPARGRSAPTRPSPCGARPRWPTPSSPTSCSSSASRARAGRRWRPGAPGCSGRCGRRPRPRTRTTPTRSTSTPSSGRTRSTRCPTPRSRRSTTTAPWPARSTPTSTAPGGVLDALAAVGVDLDDVTATLEDEGVAAFEKSLRRAARRARGQGRPSSSRGPDEAADAWPRASSGSGRRRRRPRRVRRAGHRGVPRAPERARSRSPCRAATPRARATSGWPTTAAPRSTGGRSTSTGATSAACPTTTPTRTTGWPARRCSTGWARPTPPTSCAATRCDDPYQLRLGELGRFDLVHLGLGPDGHTASLFPDSPALDADPGRLVALNEDPSGSNPHQRMTLTFAGIARARLVLVTVMGEEKREALARVAGGDDVPAARVRAERVVWLVDPPAAAR